VNPTPVHPHFDDSVLRAAWLYYREDLTQDAIATTLQVSRATVGRLLDRARREGIVRMEIDPGLLGAVGVAGALSQAFDGIEVLVVPSDGLDHDQGVTNERLARVAAQLLVSRLSGDDTLAIGWGDTVARTMTQLPTECRVHDIVTMTGGVDTYLGSLTSRFGSRLAMVPAPFLTSTADLAEAVAAESDIHRILSWAVDAQWKLVGIGALHPNASIIRFGYQTARDLECIREQGAVGDMIGQFYRADGTTVDLDIHRRRIGVDLADVAEAPGVVVAVAGGVEKRDAIAGALRMGIINILVTTEEDARFLLDNAAETSSRENEEQHAGG
jgi:lsr operon transcriptional repressor